MKRFFLLVFLFVNFSVFSQNKDISSGEDTHNSTHQKYSISNLEINSYYSDYGASYYGDYIVFASSRKHDDNKDRRWRGNNQRFLNFYIGKADENGEISSFEAVKGEGNSRFHESNASFSKDLSTVYFTRNNFYERRKGLSSERIMKIAIYIADVNSDGSWTNVRPFPYNSKEYNNGHPTLSLDGKTMYFASDMPGTIGGTDIFKVEIKESGDFGLPENLGGNVNTTGKEMFPFIASDGTLYFSSDGHEGEGRLDIFKTDSDELELAAIQNIGKPFNSSRDDFSFVMHQNLREGYFSSNRTFGKGDDDIYYFTSGESDEKLEEEEVSEPVLECTSTIVGVVKDSYDKEPISGAVVEILNELGETVYKETVPGSGSYSFVADCNAKYTVRASRSLYLEVSNLISTPKDLGQSINVDLYLSPEIKKQNGKILVDVNSIYFDFNSVEITKRAARELDKVISLMRKYPDVIIEGASHTDSRGPSHYNLELSTRRAQSTVNYIIKYGNINPNRIFAKGYGETQILNTCVDGVKCSDSEHALNRRTEFEIVNPEIFE